MFDLKKSKIYRAVKAQRFFQFLGWMKIIFLFCFLVNVLFLAFKQINLFLIFLVCALVCKILELYFDSGLKKPILKLKLEQAVLEPEQYNLAEFLSFETAKTISKAISQDQTINSTRLFYSVLAHNPELKFIFSRLLLDFENIRSRLKQNTEKGITRKIDGLMIHALKFSVKRKHQILEIHDFLIFLSRIDPVFKQILITANLSAQDIENSIHFYEFLKQKQAKKKRFWEMDNLLKMGSIGRDWTAGYTINLDKYSIDWTDILKKRGYEQIIGHEKEIQRLENILAKQTSNNALLIGEPGIGRKSIIHALAKKILFGKSLQCLNYKRIVELDVPALLAQAKTEQEVESILETVFLEAVSAGNIILIIDQLPDFVGEPRRPGAINISGILLKCLKFSQLQVIGICSFSGFHKYIEQNPSLLALFEKVLVSEISEKQTILILENKIPFYETKYKKFISYLTIRDIVKYCEKYMSAAPFPKKALDLLDEVMVYVSRYVKTKIVLPEHVAKIVTEKTRIPVGEIETQEKQILLNLENLIHKRIINQNEAVNQVAQAMRRARAEITIRKGPIGAFLFLGPTGVGKTETAKALAQIYFGSEKQIVRLDMSEFQEIKDISRLIGASEKQGLLTSKVKQKPFCLVLLDEIEKAHPDILNLFLQIIDEGHVTDGVGRKISFKNAIIIATSNAGYKIILQALKQQTKWSDIKQKLLDELFEKAIFRPEFINRFDAVVVFRPLTKENLLDIAQLMLNKLKNNLEKKHIEFEITEPLKQKIVELGYNPVFGAREMRRVIQDKIENVLARALLSGQLKKGDRIQITQDFEIIKI